MGGIWQVEPLVTLFGSYHSGLAGVFSNFEPNRPLDAFFSLNFMWATGQIPCHLTKMLPQKVNHRWWSEVQSSFKPSFKLECIPDVGPAIFRGTFVPSGPWPRWSGWGRLSWNTGACACWPPSALLRSSMCNSQAPDFGAVFDKGKSWVRLGWPVMVWQGLGSFCKLVKLVADWSFPMLRN